MTMTSLALIQQIDALLPQTQCGLCGHADGCLPYAHAIAQGESANKCVPGGQPVADALAQLLGRASLQAEPSQWQIQADGRPQRMKAIIREDECIGCTKCIQACPVDAIIGSGKLMHSILTDLCTGCELCIPPCPVDCIDLIADTQPLPTATQRLDEQNDLRSRYYAHIQREQQRKHQRQQPMLRAEINSQLFIEFSQYLQQTTTQTTQQTAIPIVQQHTTSQLNIDDAQTTIQLAKLRTQIKKLQKQLSVRPDPDKQQQLIALEQELAQLSSLP